MHEKLAMAVVPVSQTDRDRLIHILSQPIVNLPDRLPIAGQSEFHQKLVTDGMLGGIYAGPKKNLRSCEDAMYLLTIPTKRSPTKIVVQADGVSGSPCSITFARLLVNQVGQKLTVLARNNQITQKAIIAIIIEAAQQIPRYFAANIYPYDDLLNNPHFKRKVELEMRLKKLGSVASATLNILVEINQRLYVVIIGDGILGLYHPQYGHKYSLGMSFPDYPEQLSATAYGVPLSDPKKLSVGYLECPIDQDDRWIITTDGPLQQYSRTQFHRVMKMKVEAGESLDLHDDYRYNALDDCVFVSNET